MKNNKKETNSSAYKKLRRFIIGNETGKCSICKPHSGENQKNYGKHGAKKRRYKDKQ